MTGQNTSYNVGDVSIAVSGISNIKVGGDATGHLMTAAEGPYIPYILVEGTVTGTIDNEDPDAQGGGEVGTIYVGKLDVADENISGLDTVFYLVGLDDNTLWDELAFEGTGLNGEEKDGVEKDGVQKKYKTTVAADSFSEKKNNYNTSGNSRKRT